MAAFSDSVSDVLLGISMDIADIKSKRDLLELINGKLKLIFHFSDVAICTFSQAEPLCKIFLLDPASVLQKHPDYQQYISFCYSSNGMPISNFLLLQQPVVHNLETTIGPGSDLSLKVLVESGIRQVICIVLKKAEEYFGMITFYLENKTELTAATRNLILAIANLIGITVSNILYLDEINRREEEKAILLSFSDSMATVRTKQDLNVMMSDQLKRLCSIKDYVISVIHEDGELHGGFIYNKDAPYVEMPEFTKALNTRFKVQDGVFNRVMVSPHPVVYHIDELLSTQGTPEYIRFWKSIGIEIVVGIALTFGKTPIGVLWIEPADAGQLAVFHNSLFKGIIAQISVALSNILANERVENQMLEISNYKQRLEEENAYLLEEIEKNYNHSEIIGSGAEMAAVFRMMAQVSFTNSTVLLLGETGTGKELIARAIHNNSRRKDKLMVKLNCATLPAGLIESELFGHEKGSFTGAMERRIGKFELADNGTLFLDEIGEMPVELQVKLLRVLQEREIERVGGKGPIKVNVRIIAATNRDLLQEVENGKFRSDLYYRLNVFPITLPPLRNRKEDIYLLAMHFMAKFSRNTGKNVCNISHKATQDLLTYPWPGNVRELEHLMERSVLLTQGNTIKELQLSPGQYNESGKKINSDYIKTIDENERDHILKVLRLCGGKVFGPHGAACKLGVPVSTLNSKIAKLGIVKEKVFITP